MLGRFSRSGRSYKVGLMASALLLLASVSSCAWLGSAADKFDQAFNGIPSTITTFDEAGKPIDRVHGTSIRITRDEEFDTSNSDGTSNNDSSVLLISVGNSHMHHVGSSLVLVEDGIVDVTGQLPNNVSFDNAQRGTPWLNDLRYRFQNLWHGKAMTIMVRSQSGAPIAIYAGNSVDIHSTDVPKSTWLRVDGRSILIYRCDYTVYDNNLLAAPAAPRQ